VQRIVRAYDSYGRAQQQLPLEMNDAGMPAAQVSETGLKPISKPQ